MGEQKFVYAVTFFITFVLFWLHCGALALLDLTGFPSYFLRFKVQDLSKDPRQDDPAFRAKYLNG